MPESLLLSLKHGIEAHNPSRIIVGFSGGLDSSALLHGVVALKNAEIKSTELKSRGNLFKSIPIVAIHVHHGLSQNADHWLSHCQNMCDSLSVRLIAEHVILDTEHGSLENTARNARYDVFSKYIRQGDVLLLAHHQNDQVETFMMRLMRGSGLTGLSAMQSVRPFSDGLILRPWLSQTRHELEEYVASNTVAYIEDESNTDTQFDRNWWRHKLLPKLSARYPQSSISIIKSIEVLQQERQLLHDLLTPIYQNTINGELRFSPYPTMSCEALLVQPIRVQVQLVRMWLQQQSVHPSLNSDQIQRLFADVVCAKEGAIPIYQWQQHQIRRYAGKLFLLPDAGINTMASRDALTVNTPTVKQELCIRAPKELAAKHDGLGDLAQESIKLNQPLNGCLALSVGVKNGLKEGDYEVTLYQASLTAKPFKRPTKTLKKWFQEFGVPPWLRETWPVIVKNDQVVCVPSLFVCEGFTADEGLLCGYKPL